MDEFAADELALVLRLAPRAARTRLENAVALAGRLPRVVAAMLTGRVDYRRAEVILDETDHLCDEEAAQVADQVLGEAPAKTVGELRARTRKVALGIRPKETLKAARKRARQAHDVTAFDRGDGNAEITAVTSTGDAAELMAIIHSAAAQAKKAYRTSNGSNGSNGQDGGGGEQEARSMGGYRSDAFVDLIIHRHRCSTATTNNNDSDKHNGGSGSGSGEDSGEDCSAGRTGSPSPSGPQPGPEPQAGAESQRSEPQTAEPQAGAQTTGPASGAGAGSGAGSGLTPPRRLQRRPGVGVPGRSRRSRTSRSP